ncbi:MAG: hypothetical protein R6W71_01435 [Bacteroidales bacterium]
MFRKWDIPYFNVDVHMGDGRFCMVNMDGVPLKRDGVPVNEFLVNALHIDHLPSPIAHAEMNIGV